MSSNQEEEVAGSFNPRRSLSCTKCFDALWFCYSPVHQMQQYYRHGVLDNCSAKWSALFDCLNLKTKRSSELQNKAEDDLICGAYLRRKLVIPPARLALVEDFLVSASESIGCIHRSSLLLENLLEILETREKSKEHIWSFRTVEEASAHWEELFGHVNDGE